MGDLGGRRRNLEVVILSLLLQNLVLASHALNHEGKALLRFKERVKKDPFGALSSWEESSFETHHCSWFGVDCVDGHVVSLTLKDLCLEGTLVPELGNLAHIKLIILRNNSFSGVILEEIGALKELEVLDLGYNNFSGTLPNEWGDSISILLLDNNGLFCQVSPELEQLMVISEVQVDEGQLSAVDEGSQRNVKVKASCAAKTPHTEMMRRGIQELNPIGRVVHRFSPPPDPRHAADVPTADLQPATPSPPPSSPPPPPPPPPSSSATNSSVSTSAKDENSSKTTVIISGSVGAFIVLCLIVGLIMWRSKKIATVGPWRTGLSGQLRKSLVSGLPKLQRLELETACEDFSNVVGSTLTGTLYKGTLSSGAEIAVLSHAVKNSKDWSMNMESQFRDKVSSLSELNHKNFLNLLGYCEEDVPFTRMLVFEYAPSGTLFEHLHGMYLVAFNHITDMWIRSSSRSVRLELEPLCSNHSKSEIVEMSKDKFPTLEKSKIKPNT